MAIRKQGQFWYSDSAADIREVLCRDWGQVDPITVFADAVCDCGGRVFDLQVDEEYGEGLKTNFADVANVAGRPAGAVTAAKFLQRFTARYPWAHLDIAGTAWKGGAAKGSTGRPVGLLVQYLLGQQSAAKARSGSGTRRRKAAA